MRRTVQMYDNTGGKPIHGKASSFLTTIRPLKQWVEERSVTLSATESDYCDLPNDTKVLYLYPTDATGKHLHHLMEIIPSK